MSVKWHEYFDDRVTPEPNTGCLLWDGAINTGGYAWLTHKESGLHTGHRLSWHLWHGSIPSKLCVLHKCDVRLCVNPAHLFLGTYRDNVHDMMNKGRYRGGGRGSSNGNAKITEGDVKRMRTIAKNSKRSHESIARQFGISQVAASNAISGRTWSHVE